MIKIYDTDKIEFQKDGNHKLCTTIFDIEGDYIPAWSYKTTYSVPVVPVASLQVLNSVSLQNKVINVSSTTAIGGYTYAKLNDRIYADKQGETLASGTIYRIQVYIDTGFETRAYYSDLFRKI